MSPSCDNCGEHVSSDYYRVRCGNDGELHGCPACACPAARERLAAGVDPLYRIRTDADGNHIERQPADAAVATDGGEPR